MGSLTELKISSDIIEVIGFLAYETVREVRTLVSSVLALSCTVS